MTMEQSDRRIFERNEGAFKVSFIDGYNNIQGQALTCDISAKGLKIAMENRLAQGAGLEIWINLPGSSLPHYTRGEVVWTKAAEKGKWLSGIALERADFINWQAHHFSPM